MQYSYINIIMIVVLFAFMYFMIIRPQSKRNKELKLLQGTVTVKVRIAPKVEIELDRNSIRSLVAK